jgi:TATA-box binding protein (TBP) (component of TFIID and TFIIIB)
MYSRTQRPKSDAPVWQTGQSSFLGTETVNSTNHVSDEFDTNLELVKIAYKVKHLEYTIDTTIYSCNLENQSRQLVT